MEKIKVNTILKTKDGRQVGNAIVIEEFIEHYWEIKTDYGNTMVLNENEIREMFYIESDDNNDDIPAKEKHKHLINQNKTT
jgi:hypothetical protein